MRASDAIDRGTEAAPGAWSIEQSVASRFEAVARVRAERPALCPPGAPAVTYGELNAEADRVALSLRRLGGSKASPVALFLDTGAPLFAAILGALKAGRFYCPLDPALDRAWLRAVFGALSPELVVADESRLAEVGELAGTGTHRADYRELAAGPRGGASETAASPDDLAYVLFTSGSTGSPKGVLQSHRNVLHNVRRLTSALGISPHDRMTLLSSPSFGASASDVFGALLNGAALCPLSVRGDGLRELPSRVAAHGLTIFHSVPSVFRSFLAMSRGDGDFSSLRAIRLGGEPVLASDFELYRKSFRRGCRMHVGLGATEMNVILQWSGDHDTVWPPAPPLGRPAEGAEILLLDDQCREERGAESGEIAVVSRTLAVGYWRNPEATARAFPPASGRPGLRMYRTGDLARRLPDGSFVHLGRRDSVVKIRGFRVDTSEVETALLRVAAIREAAVVGREGPLGTRLVAYVVAGDAGSARNLRRALAECLPDHMVPEAFVPLEALPRTQSGKVDRAALPAPPSTRAALDSEFFEPRGERERAIAGAFAETLGLDRVGAEDDFFDLGGTSLLAADLLMRLSERLGAKLVAEDLIEAPTPAALAVRIAADAAPPGSLVTIQRGGERPPVFLVPGGTGEGEDLFLGARLARHVGPEFPFFGFRSLAAPHPSVAELAARHARQIRAAQPHGPYFLVGECVGGVLALEIARRLRSEGERIAMLAMLDTPFPTVGRRLEAVLRTRAPRALELVERLRYFAGRVRHHASTVRRLPGGRLAYLRKKASIATQDLAGGSGSPRAAASRMRASYAGRLLARRPAPFDGRLGFVESEAGRDAGYGKRWARLAPRVRVVSAPGDHYTYIVDHIDGVGRVLRAWLEEAGRETSGL